MVLPESKPEQLANKVPIRQHNCLRGALDLMGEPIKYSGNIPIAALCLVCKQEVPVNIPAWQREMLKRQTPRKLS